MLSFFTSTIGVLIMSGITLGFIVLFFAYVGWKLFKLSDHKPMPGEKAW